MKIKFLLFFNLILLSFFLFYLKTSSGPRDVDMRFLPSVMPSAAAATTIDSAAHGATEQPVTSPLNDCVTTALGLDKDITMSSNSNSSSGVVTVDYSQYLKDSNLSFDKGDLCKFCYFFFIK